MKRTTNPDSSFHFEESGAATATRVAERPQPAAPERSRAYRRLRVHRRFMPVLVVITILSTLGIAALAYVGTRSNAISSAQSRMQQDVRVEHQLLTDQGASLTVQNGHLISGVDTVAMTLNGDTTLVDRTRNLVNADATIYQLEGMNLVAVSTNLPTVNSGGQPASGTRALGDPITGAAYQALQGQCGPTDTDACHHTYGGIVTVRGIQYVAAFEPLYDVSGTFVGALGAATPLDAVLAPSVQLSVILLLVGLLVALAGIVGGSWIFGSVSSKMLDHLDERLITVADAATNVEQLAYAQAERCARQGRVAMQVSEHIRALDTLASAMDDGHTALHESAGEIWAEMSQPGLAPSPQTALRIAQQSAVTAGHLGAAAADARDRCRQLVTLMNHVLAESNVVRQSGGDMQERAQELRESVERVEVTLGARLMPRRSSIIPEPLRNSRLGRIITTRLRAITKDQRTDARDRGAASQSSSPTRQDSASSQGQTGVFRAQSPRGDDSSWRDETPSRQYRTLGDTGHTTGETRARRATRPSQSGQFKSRQTGEWPLPSASQISRRPGSGRDGSRPGVPPRGTGSFPSVTPEQSFPRFSGDDSANWGADDSWRSGNARWDADQD